MLATALDLSFETSDYPATPLGVDRAWLAQDIQTDDWLVPLDADCMEELEVMVRRMRDHPLPVMLRTLDEFEIPALRRAYGRAKDVLDTGCGFAVFDALPMDDHDIEHMIGCYWTLGQLIGVPVAQKWDGTMLYDVMDTGQSYSYGVRGSATSVELVFHTDNAFGAAVPDYVGLLCEHPAVEGGLSRFCSLYTVHNRMLEAHPALLGRLYEPMLFDRQAEHLEGAEKTSWAPFFRREGDRLSARANVSLVRKGYDVAGEEMDSKLVEALEAVQEVSNAEELWYEAPIERGQVQYLNNHELAHYRSAFTDHPDPKFKRHLHRTWHRDRGTRAYDGL